MGLILASASPRRQELLRLITEDFTVFPAAVDESLPPVLSVQKAAQDLARKKALAVANEYPNDRVLLIPRWCWKMPFSANRKRRNMRQRCFVNSPERHILSSRV